jgi:hypothetical protein
MAVMFSILLLLVVCVISFMLYFLPCYIAKRRLSTHFGLVLVVNLLFGWTLLGWIGALVLALI